MKIRNLAIVLSCLLPLTAMAEAPKITGKPIIEQPPLLHWTLDYEKSKADLEEQTANRVNDLHAGISQCDLVFSTAGNYNMALKELFYDHFLKHNPEITNWFYTTSPPVSFQHAQTNEFTMGNFRSICVPTVAAGPKKLMEKLEKAGLLASKPIPVIRNQGNVLLVKKGNPKNIKSIWDLGRPDVKVVTSNPYNEAGSFGNYSNSIYNIAASEKSEKEAKELFDSLFNGEQGKWYAADRIHHRGVPWSVAYGHADAGPMFYHLALHSKRQFPDMFDIVPLGGTVEQPQAAKGNKIGTMFIAKLKGNDALTESQKRYQEKFIQEFMTPEFTKILEKHGLTRPPEFKEIALNM
ncbi:MAG: substrate-binding domain-containing protein [Gammaproteobacteria bacterium]|jgi:hypothetical protein